MLASILSIATALAQVVTTEPSHVQTDSEDIIITFHADQGNKGLSGLGPNDAVYAHTGVITNRSASPTDWQYAPTWLDNNPKYKLKYVDTNTWQLSMSNINDFYGITDADVVVKKMMFVFRNSNGSKEGKTADGGDIAVDVYAPGLQVSLSSDASTMGVVTTDNNTVRLKAATTVPADITINVDGTTIASSAPGSMDLSVDYSIASGHRAIVTAIAEADGSTVADTLALSALLPTDEKAYPNTSITQGVVDNGSEYIFCIAAPSKKNVTLVGSWNDYAIDPSTQLYHATDCIALPTDTTCMKNAYTLRQPYYWISIPKASIGNDFCYFYLIDGTTAVADPYATLILDPNNDRYIAADVFPNLPEYPQQLSNINVPLAWHTLLFSKIKADKGFTPVAQDRMVVYELLLRDFTSDNSGTPASGNIREAIGKLDYLKDLGVNAIELMPVMEFGGNNSWGYNPNFYFAPDKAYGTPDDYRTLVAEAHARGMAVILDVVFNQADSSHPWWVMYNPAENPFFNASSPHAYNVLNDWNQGNPLVELQWTDAVKHWIEEYGFDGYRFDLVKGLGDNQSYGTSYNRVTNTFSTPSESATNRINQSRIDRMARIHAAIRSVKSDAIFINEDLATATEENQLAQDGDLNWANINNPSCQFAMGYQAESNMNSFYAPLDGGRTAGSTISYAESHDEEWLTNRASGLRHP